MVSMFDSRTTTAIEAHADRALSAEPPPTLRSAVTNDVFAGLSKNTATGRRVADLLRGFLRAMGEPKDIVQQANALRAAELTVAAESARAKLLAGDGDIDAVARLEGVARRSVADLRLPAAQREPAEPTLAEYLRDRYGARNEEPEDDEADETHEAEPAATPPPDQGVTATGARPDGSETTPEDAE
jgi:hypothetical protein